MRGGKKKKLAIDPRITRGIYTTQKCGKSREWHVRHCEKMLNQAFVRCLKIIITRHHTLTVRYFKMGGK